MRKKTGPSSCTTETQGLLLIAVLLFAGCTLAVDELRGWVDALPDLPQVTSDSNPATADTGVPAAEPGPDSASDTSGRGEASGAVADDAGDAPTPDAPLAPGCGSGLDGSVSCDAVVEEARGAGGVTGAGGAMDTGGAVGSGGVLGSGGEGSTGGVVGSGGVTGTGGESSTGGVVGSGGVTGTGGESSSGGVVGSGGIVETGGAPGTGGVTGSGGTSGNTPIKLTGESFGTGPPWGNNPAVNYEKAFDGRIFTYFDDTTPSGGYTGIDLGAGAAARVVLIRYYPRTGYNLQNRMTGGRFQCSSTSRIDGYTDLHTITSPPRVAWTEVTIADSPTCRYLRYLGPPWGYTNVAEIEFWGL